MLGAQGSCRHPWVSCCISEPQLLYLRNGNDIFLLVEGTACVLGLPKLDFLIYKMKRYTLSAPLTSALGVRATSAPSSGPTLPAVPSDPPDPGWDCLLADGSL